MTLGCLPHVPHLSQAVWPLAHPSSLSVKTPGPMASGNRVLLPFRAQLAWGWQSRCCYHRHGFCQKPSEKATSLHLVSGEAFCSIFSLDRSLVRPGGGLTYSRTDYVSFPLSSPHWFPTPCMIKDIPFAFLTYKAFSVYVSIYIFTSVVLSSLHPPCIL